MILFAKTQCLEVVSRSFLGARNCLPTSLAMCTVLQSLHRSYCTYRYFHGLSLRGSNETEDVGVVLCRYVGIGCVRAPSW